MSLICEKMDDLPEGEDHDERVGEVQQARHELVNLQLEKKTTEFQL
jgi:hypothetical protein